jgi:hypothetical protein
MRFTIVSRLCELPVFLFLATLFALPLLAQTIRIDRTTGHAINSFIPTETLGAGIDRLNSAATDKLFAEPVMKRVLSAGWQTVSYRQNTELYIEAWHWNPRGSWSDSGGHGYFTGSADLGDPIRHSYGYYLPHRGFTRNDGANTGYSRMTDGSTSTYWKSNPYLTKPFAGEDDHPQWVVMDLASAQPVNAIRIAWSEPYARVYRVEYWTGDDPIKQATKGTWVTFPGGIVSDGKGGNSTVQLSSAPVLVRYIRIWNTESSNTCDNHGSADKRNCVGFAINEIYVGTASLDGTFHDIVRHTPDQDQTTTYCSSVDPWHEPSGINDKRDQAGIDFFYTSGYTRGLPAMVPVSMLYGTPEDSAVQIAYLLKRRYPISYVEMGEAPDGQYTLPEDYAALYLQWATAIHKVDPKLKLGGPAFQGVTEDIQVWPDAQGRTSWLGRFISYLQTHGRMADFTFLSFEHYPYEPCKVQWSSLYDEPTLISHIVDVWQSDGLPQSFPLFVTELNIAWNTGESFVDIFGALWLADFVGSYLAVGGDALYYFHYLPAGLYHGCNGSMGTFGLFNVDSNYQIKQPVSQFFASQLINQEWVQPGNGTHQMFPSTSDIVDPAGHTLVTGYALLRPDGQWAVMLINKDQENAHEVHIVFEDKVASQTSGFIGRVNVVRFGADQYRWNPSETGGSADPDGPPLMFVVQANRNSIYELPKASVTILRGKN